MEKKGNSNSSEKSLAVREPKIRPADTVKRLPARRKKKKPIVLIIVLVLLAALGGGIFYLVNKGQEFYADTQVMEADVEDIKAGIKKFADDVKKGDYESADASIVRIDNAVANLRTELSDPKWELATNLPDIGEDIQTASKLIDIVSEASDKLMKPAVKYLREKGLPKKEDFTLKKMLSADFAVKLNEYSELIDTLCPEVEKLIADFNSLPQFKIEKLESKISKYRTLVKENENDVHAYIKFLQNTSTTLMKPAAEILNGKTLKLSFSEGSLTEKLGPEMAEQLSVIADLVDKLSPAIDKVMEELETLPPVKIEKVQKKIDEIKKLLKDEEIIRLRKLAEESTTALIRPAIEVMTNYPYSSLKSNGGINVKVMKAYLDLAEKIKPFVLKLSEEIKKSEYLKKYPDISEKITSKLDSMQPIFDDFDEYKPLVDLVLGDGSDKLYVVVAMNSAEIRACGGFPGSIGTIVIRNGILKVGKFTSVYENLTYKDRKLIKPTKEEDKLFKELGFGTKTTSSTLNPHFPRVAQIIAKAYQKMHKLKKLPDGVIAMTPHIIGRLIGATEPITLSNGKKLDSKYSVKYLQRDIYFQYFKKATTKKKRTKANDKTDALFAEAANLTLKNVMSSLSFDGIKKLFNVVKASGKDRVFMMWMSDSEAQKKVKELGFSGALNYDKNNPEIGVYFNIYDANKLGSFTDLSVKVGKGKKNSNGTITYLVIVRLKNTIDKKSEKIGKSNDYITSRKGGASMRTIMYFFAPAGGNITGFGSNRKDAFQRNGKYKKLKIFYTPKFYIAPRQDVMISFYVTTAKGVTKKPKVVHMPMLTKYMKAKEPK